MKKAWFAPNVVVTLHDDGSATVMIDWSGSAAYADNAAGGATDEDVSTVSKVLDAGIESGAVPSTIALPAPS